MKQLAQQMSGMMAQMQAAMKNMTPEQRAMMEKMMKGKMPQAAAAAPKTVYTAKGSGSVNGFSCTKYEGDLSGEKEVGSMRGASRAAQAHAQRFPDVREDEAVLHQPPKLRWPTLRCALM